MSEADESDRRLINGTPATKRFDSAGNEIEVDWVALLDPGMIKVGDPSHRRLIEETGNDDWRIVYVGDAAKLDENDSDNEGDNNE